jgi:hypothetical protein
MKIILEHIPSSILTVLRTNNVVYFNKDGSIIECNGILYNDTEIKMIPVITRVPISLTSDDEVYYYTE